jgi:NAD-dependent deacetylase
MKKKIVVLSGSGVSAESGLSTFRGAGGLWEGHDVTQVASPQAWNADKKMVLRFYNQRRKQLGEVNSNSAHIALVKLEERFDVQIVTQNVDDLHERAGSTNILHLHGELRKVRSTVDPSLVYDIGYKELNLGDKCEKGSQLRPHVVWFGEAVPEIQNAAAISTKADIFIVVGTSLIVYPAASLINYVPKEAMKYIIDPVKPESYGFISNIEFIQEKATVGIPKLVEELLMQQ